MNGTAFDQITAFLMAVEHAGFTAAGQAIGRDGSILSRRVSQLEKRLGVRLMERTTRRVTLTETGEAFYRRMRALVQSMEDTEQDTIETSGRVRGLLRVSMPATFGRLWIAPIINDFLAINTELKVETIYEDRYVDLVAESVDVAVRIGNLADSRLIARQIAPARKIVCASPGYLARAGHPSSPNDLAGHTCVGMSGGAVQQSWRFCRDGQILSIRVAGRFLTNDAHSLVHAAISGAGIALVSDWNVGHDLCSGRLVPVLPDWVIENEEAIYAVHPSGRLTPAKTRAFIDWLVKALSPLPWTGHGKRMADGGFETA